MEENPATEKILKRIELTTCILLGLTTAGAWAFHSAKVALGVFAGGLIVTLSFQVLKWQLRKAFRTPDRIPKKGRLFLSYYLRFLSTLVLVFLVIHFGWADPIAFVVGLSVVVLSIVLVGGFEFSVMLTKEGDN